MGRKLAFIIEDDPDIRTSLQQVCELEGFASASAGNGREALDALRCLSKLPELILLDMMMPGMNGEEFLTEKDQDRQLADIPVVVITAGPYQKRTITGNIRGLISKPVDLLYLSTILQQFR